MSRGLFLVLLLVAGVAGAAAGTRSASGQPSSVLLAGPVLAGQGVAWSESSGAAEAVFMWPGRGSAAPVYKSTVDSISELDGSRILLAFSRSYPGCPPSPSYVCPQLNDALAGPLPGPFHPLMTPRSCFLPLPNSMDVDGSVVGFVRPDCKGDLLKLVVRDLGKGRRTTVVHETPVSASCCSGVRVAGRFAAWLEQRAAVVYDRVAGRELYRARLGSQPVLDFDLQRDGKLVLALGPSDITAPSTVAWVSPTRPKLHVLPSHGHATRVEVGLDRIVLLSSAAATRNELIVSDLAGRARTIARFRPPLHSTGAFDFDGTRLTWASDRITSSRVDCPPPGQGRPCVRRFTGITTIWAGSASGGKPSIVAKLPFEDVPG
jgi:hypothetical protein